MDNELIAPTQGDRIEFPLSICWKEGDKKLRGEYLNCGCLYVWNITTKQLKPELCVKHKVHFAGGPERKTILREYMKRVNNGKNNTR